MCRNHLHLNSKLSDFGIKGVVDTVLVDTPGFDDTVKSDLEILNMISDWLNAR